MTGEFKETLPLSQVQIISIVVKDALKEDSEESGRFISALSFEFLGSV